MDAALGCTLLEHVASSECFTERHFRHLARQLLQALAFVHSCGVAHRDVKARAAARGSPRIFRESP